LAYTVTVAGSPSNTGAGSRANAVAGVSPIPAQQSIAQWFNPAAFTAPAAYTWGTLGRNSLAGPAIYNLDATVSRKFTLGEQRDLGFRWEMFNTFNHPQFGLPNATAGVGGAGTITTTQRSNRQMQVAVKNAHLRAKPTTHSALLATLARGTKVDVSELVDNGKWAHVKVAGKTGYISANLLK